LTRSDLRIVWCRILAECDNHFGAVADPRMHHQLLPNNVFVENWSAHGVDFRFPSLDMQARALVCNRCGDKP